jgi:FkbM family methyltransferase
MTAFFHKYAYYFSSLFKLARHFRPLTLVARIFLHQVPPGIYPIQLPRLGLRLNVRGVMDIWSVKETFLDRFYERYGCPLQDGWKIIDIGGGIGDFTLFAAKDFSHNQVVAYEPTPQSFALLQDNLSANQASNVHAYNEAIWSSTGTLEIDTSLGEPGQFVSRDVQGRPAGEGGSTTGAPRKVIVPSIPFSEAFRRTGWQAVDLLKIDAEGAEYEILFSLEDEILNKVRRMVMETHDSLTHYTHSDLLKFLTEKGFQVRHVVNVVHADLGYLYAEQR